MARRSGLFPDARRRLIAAARTCRAQRRGAPTPRPRRSPRSVAESLSPLRRDPVRSPRAIGCAIFGECGRRELDRTLHNIRAKEGVLDRLKHRRVCGRHRCGQPVRAARRTLAASDVTAIVEHPTTAAWAGEHFHPSATDAARQSPRQQIRGTLAGRTADQPPHLPAAANASASLGRASTASASC